MRPAHTLGAAISAVLFLSVVNAPSRSEARFQSSYSEPAIVKPSSQRLALIRHDGTELRSRPGRGSSVLARLVEQTQVQVLRRQNVWLKVRIWASVSGWLPISDVVFRAPWASTSTYVPPEIHYKIKPRKAAPISTTALITVNVSLVRSSGRTVGNVLRSGTRVTVTAWKQDEKGELWYRIRNGWAPGSAVQFVNPHPAATELHGIPLWKSVSGKGMWLTLGTITDSNPNLIVRSAIRNGITHFYIEAGISPLGFHGKGAAGPLIDAAHLHHIAVIAWVYPYLYDSAADIELTREVAKFRSNRRSGFDGIAADLERNVSLSTVRGYSQLVRYYLGTKYLLVGVTYPPQSFPDYPFAEVAHNYNLLAPMDYWHQTKTSSGLDYGHTKYGYTYAYRYAADSLRAIRRVSGPVVMAPIGQTFDNFGRLEMGPHAPSAGEIRGFLDGSKKSGAAGVSFFQWMTAGVSEWQTIHDYRF
jgi:uncharacterized protein YgiM (DUF1202 family)